MARYRPYDYSQMMMVPVTLSEQLVPGSLEHTIHYLVEERLDMRGFDERYRNDETGRRAYDPRVLMKVVLYGYSLGMKGSRRLEAACKQNVIFMALTCGEKPDHSTIADFVSGMEAGLLTNLFVQVLLVCLEEGLLSGTHFAIDGVKLSSNASKEFSGTRAELIRKKDKLRQLVKTAMKEHRQIDRQGGDGMEAEREVPFAGSALRRSRTPPAADGPAQAGLPKQTDNLRPARLCDRRQERRADLPGRQTPLS